MTDFSDKLRLKEMAEEDIYFARRDRELIEALHEKASAARQSGADRAIHSPEQQSGSPGNTGNAANRSGSITGRCRDLISRLLKGARG